MDGQLSEAEFIKMIRADSREGACVEVKLTEEVMKRIDTLAHTVGVTSDKLATVLTKQGMVEGYSGILFLIAAFVGIYALYKLFIKLNKKMDEDDDKEGPYIIGVIGSGVITLFCFIQAAKIMYLFNPEYFVVTKLLSILK